MYFYFILELTMITTTPQVMSVSTNLQYGTQSPISHAFSYQNYQSFSNENYLQNWNTQPSYQFPQLTYQEITSISSIPLNLNSLADIRHEILKNFSPSFDLTINNSQNEVMTSCETPPRLSHYPHYLDSNHSSPDSYHSSSDGYQSPPIQRLSTKRKISFTADEKEWESSKVIEESVIESESTQPKKRRRRRKKSVNEQILRQRRDLANDRERLRIKRIRSAYSVLENKLPSYLTHPSMRKVDILSSAMEYILDLKDML